MQPIITASAPCRIDMGGTLDISTFYYPLMRFSPCTVNIALDMRTRVAVHSYKKGWVKISSGGFQEVECPSGRAPFDQPLGLMFAVADFFGADGVYIDIVSSSPVRSALGGSSSAAVALAGALMRMTGQAPGRPRQKQIAVLAHHIETIAAQAPCGIQDHLAAAYGGVNVWYWRPPLNGSMYRKKVLVKKRDFPRLEDSILVAYCGEPHESLNINGKWVRQFVSGRHRDAWREIIQCVHGFVEALSVWDVKRACRWMNRETRIRRELTPDVFNDLGEKLAMEAERHHCGARFAGAGGGGCIWACGEKKDIQTLKGRWETLLSTHPHGRLLDVCIDGSGLVFH